jgi:hypothetical protein
LDHASNPSSPTACLIWVSSDRARLYHSPVTNPASAQIDRADAATGAEYFEAIADAARECQRLLILGPDMTAFHFRIHLLEHQPALYRKIAGFEAAGLPSAAQVAGYFRKYAVV